MSEGFASLGLSRDTVAAIARGKLGLPTPLQMKVIPPALLGRDIVAVSAPGSGRTTAFLIGLIERLGHLAGSRALVLARTKGRLQEIHEHFTLERMQSFDAASWSGTKRLVAPHKPHLREFRQFTGIVRVTFIAHQKVA